MIVRYACDPEIIGECQQVYPLDTRRVIVLFGTCFDGEEPYLEAAKDLETQIDGRWVNMRDAMNCGKVIILESGRLV